MSKTSARKLDRHRYDESIVAHYYLACSVLVRGKPEMLEGRHYETRDLEVEDRILGRKTGRQSKRFFHVLGEGEPAGTICSSCVTRRMKEAE